MKKLLFIFLFNVSILICKGQEIIVANSIIYKYELMIPESRVDDSFYMELKDLVRLHRSKLVFNQQIAYYIPLKTEYPIKHKLYNHSKNFLNFTFSYNLIEKYVNTYTDWLTESYVYQTPINFYDWELQNESKLINGILCFKAISNQKLKIYNSENLQTVIFVAWYAPSISCKIGPNNHNGLPGAILEIFDGRGTIIAEKIEFNQTIENLKVKNHTEITKDELEIFQNKILKLAKSL